MSEVPELIKMPELMKREAPSPPLFRKAVETIPKQRDRDLIKLLYLTAARVSEVITQASPYDIKHKKSMPYGRELRWQLDEFEGEKVLILTLATAKRRWITMKAGQAEEHLVPKLIALPVNPKYEPWTFDLLKRIAKHKTLSFNTSRFTALRVVRKNLSPIDPKIHTHSLRHYRISHLMEYYNFDPYDVIAYTGWTYKSGLQKMSMPSGFMDTYAHLSWKKYFPKLLKVAA